MGIRISRLRLAGLSETTPSYEVSFCRQGTNDYRPLSVIAGQSQTGKTTIVDFITYALGDSHMPRHDEIRANVRSALLEMELDAVPTVVERAAISKPSSFASVWEGRLGALDTDAEQRLIVEPTGDPSGLSQFILGGMGLAGVMLPDSAVKDDTNVSTLSIRDMFRVFVIPNEHLDSKDLVFEHGAYMVAQKYRQSIDVMFGVHDNEQALIQGQIKMATEKLRTAEGRLNAFTLIAERDAPEGRTELQKTVDEAATRIAELNSQIRTLDARQLSSDQSSARLRTELDDALAAEKAATVRVRDRDSLLGRLDALRGQYADDHRKLAFLVDAEKLFDPLKVTVCPVCFSDLDPVNEIDGHCGLCHHPVKSSSASTTGEDDTIAGSAGTITIAAAELKAIRGRLTSLADYMGKLTTDADRLHGEAEGAKREAAAAAEALDRVSSAPAPWLARRDRLTMQTTEARLLHQAAAASLRAWTHVDDEQRRVGALRAEVELLKASRKRAQPDRDNVMQALSSRFADILEEIRYPKLDKAYVEPKTLVPYVRGLPYTEASSGGKVVIALAWNLALWEVSYELEANAPGLLILDSPQKNLGHFAKDDDEFADTKLVERFYTHVKTWLAGEGIGAQAIIVDNSPPEVVADDIVVNFTRNPNIAPYGLISDAIA